MPVHAEGRMGPAISQSRQARPAPLLQSVAQALYALYANSYSYVETHMPEGTSLGGRIRKLRLKADTTLRKLARDVRISAAHLSDIEHGRRMPSDEVLRRIATELAPVGATYDDLRILKPKLEKDLEQWVTGSSEVRQLLREIKNRGGAREMLKRLRAGEPEES